MTNRPVVNLELTTEAQKVDFETAMNALGTVTLDLVNALSTNLLVAGITYKTSHLTPHVLTQAIISLHRNNALTPENVEQLLTCLAEDRTSHFMPLVQALINLEKAKLLTPDNRDELRIWTLVSPTDVFNKRVSDLISRAAVAKPPVKDTLGMFREEGASAAAADSRPPAPGAK